MLMATRLIRVVTYRKELPPINPQISSMKWSCDHVRERDKWDTLNLRLQKTHGHQTSQGTDLQWEIPILKATWPFDHVTDEKWRDSLRNFHYHLLWLIINLPGYYNQCQNVWDKLEFSCKIAHYGKSSISIFPQYWQILYFGSEAGC